MLAQEFNNAIDVWIKALESYSFEQLCAKPAPNSWSLGQVYMHLIESANHSIKQIDTCLTTNEHAAEETSPAVKTLFARNSLPDRIIEGPPSNALTPQPESKEQIVNALMQVKAAITSIDKQIGESAYQGKTRHPGLAYLNAAEWLQFAEMHFRHHFRQKQRIDAFLKETAF